MKLGEKADDKKWRLNKLHLVTSHSTDDVEHRQGLLGLCNIISKHTVFRENTDCYNVGYPHGQHAFEEILYPESFKNRQLRLLSNTSMH